MPNVLIVLYVLVVARFFFLKNCKTTINKRWKVWWANLGKILKLPKNDGGDKAGEDSKRLDPLIELFY